MQAIIIKNCNTINEQHAAVITRHIEGVGSTFFYQELTLIFGGEIVAGGAFPERFLAGHVIQAAHYGFGVRGGIKINLVEIAQRMANIIIRCMQPLPAHKLDCGGVVCVENSNGHSERAAGAASIGHCNINIQRRFGFVADRNTIFQLQIGLSAIEDNFETVIADDKIMTVANIRISQRKARHNGAGNIIMQGQIANGGAVLERITADDFRNAASVRAGPGKLQRLRTAIFKVPHLNVVSASFQVYRH